MIKRELYMSRIRPFIGTELIKVMTGIRRCGKSVMLELIQQELTESGVSPTQFIAINFEDMSYSHLQTAQALHDEITKRAKEIDGKVYGGEIVYTGPLDELFNLDLGALPYRTLDMKFETLDMDQFQPVGTVNYTTSEDYTRITEFKNMTGQILPGKTTIMKEYSKAYTPGSGETPYYAILEPENRELYERYLERVQNLTNFHPVGRLAEYRYYDMDAVTNSALDLSDEIIACHA